MNGKVVRGWMHYRRSKNVRLLDVCYCPRFTGQMQLDLPSLVSADERLS